MDTIIDGLNNVINTLNNSQFFAAVMVIFLNVYTKYIALDISSFQDNFFKKKFVRRFMIFVMAFTATKDIVKSMIITAVFIILVFELFNENSSITILPKELKQYDTNKDNKLSPEEIKNMYEQLRKEGKL